MELIEYQFEFPQQMNAQKNAENCKLAKHSVSGDHAAGRKYNIIYNLKKNKLFKGETR